MHHRRLLVQHRNPCSLGKVREKRLRRAAIKAIVIVIARFFVMEDLIYVKETPQKGLGIFATRDILKDEIITEFKGPFVRIERLEGIPREVQDHLFNVGVGEYIIAREPGARTNHSCDPNAGIARDVFLVAMRDIKKDEEVTFDYSMITADDWTLGCSCGSPSCRKTIGNYRDLADEIKKRYEKYTPDWIKRT